MGKNLRQQRRGKGSIRYRSPSHNYIGKVSYDFIPAGAKSGIVKDIVDAPGRYLPLAKVEFGGRNVLHIPSKGLEIGTVIDFETPEKGNILELGKIPEGSSIFNIELHPGDGGRLCRSSGSFATLVTKETEKCIVLLPSKAKKTLSSRCRATIGTAAGSGRPTKPFRKAGVKHYAMKSMGRYYPMTSGVAKNAVDHPFGGSNLGKHKSVSRHMPPGKKVGSISPRRMGKRKRKK
jgi:large subunit ribosomal protein L2